MAEALEQRKITIKLCLTQLCPLIDKEFAQLEFTFIDFEFTQSVFTFTDLEFA